MSDFTINQLKETAQQARCLLLKAIFDAGSGHPGGSLSAVEILTYLYFRQMKFDDQQPEQASRDRFILSKGHAVAALYSVLSLRGLLDASSLASFRQLNSQLQGHPYSGSHEWIDGSSGSLGQGLSQAIGIAKGFQLQSIDANSYVLIGDGEMQEGMIWEGALFSAHHQLSNLCVIVDYNKLQSDAPVKKIAGIEPLREKWQSFGWHVVSCDGHSFDSIDDAFAAFKQEAVRPTVIVADTVKGKGVSFMENKPEWHGALTLSETDYRVALSLMGVTHNEMGKWFDVGWWGDTT